MGADARAGARVFDVALVAGEEDLGVELDDAAGGLGDAHGCQPTRNYFVLSIQNNKTAGRGAICQGRPGREPEGKGSGSPVRPTPDAARWMARTRTPMMRYFERWAAAATHASRVGGSPSVTHPTNCALMDCNGATWSTLTQFPAAFRKVHRAWDHCRCCPSQAHSFQGSDLLGGTAGMPFEVLTVREHTLPRSSPGSDMIQPQVAKHRSFFTRARCFLALTSSLWVVSCVGSFACRGRSEARVALHGGCLLLLSPRERAGIHWQLVGPHTGLEGVPNPDYGLSISRGTLCAYAARIWTESGPLSPDEGPFTRAIGLVFPSCGRAHLLPGRPDNEPILVDNTLVAFGSASGSIPAASTAYRVWMLRVPLVMPKTIGAVCIVLWRRGLVTRAGRLLRRALGIGSLDSLAPTCRSCGYCVIGITSGRCPECGQSIETLTATDQGT